MKPNWRTGDLCWYLGFVIATAVSVQVGASGLAVVLGGLALLQLVETILHAVSDACRSDLSEGGAVVGGEGSEGR